MDGSPQAAVTPEGVRDGDPAVLAALVARRGPAVLAFCDAVCDQQDVSDAVAEAFARFRALVAALGDIGDADPDAYLLGATRHAAAAMARVPSDGRGVLRVLGRGAGPETYAAVPGLLAARADSMLGAEDLERLSRLLEKSAACREVEAAFRRAERNYRSPPARPLSIDRTRLVIAAMQAAAPVAPEYADLPIPGRAAGADHVAAEIPAAPVEDPPAPPAPVEDPAPEPEVPAGDPPSTDPPAGDPPADPTPAPVDRDAPATGEATPGRPDPDTPGAEGPPSGRRTVVVTVDDAPAPAAGPADEAPAGPAAAPPEPAVASGRSGPRHRPPWSRRKAGAEPTAGVIRRFDADDERPDPAAVPDDAAAGAGGARTAGEPAGGPGAAKEATALPPTGDGGPTQPADAGPHTDTEPATVSQPHAGAEPATGAEPLTEDRPRTDAASPTDAAPPADAATRTETGPSATEADGDHDPVLHADDPALAGLTSADAGSSPTRVYRARRGLPARGTPRMPTSGGINLPRAESASASERAGEPTDHGPVFRLVLPAIAIVVAVLVMLAIAGVFGGGDPAPAAIVEQPVATQLHPDAGLTATTEAATTPAKPAAQKRKAASDRPERSRRTDTTDTTGPTGSAPSTPVFDPGAAPASSSAATAAVRPSATRSPAATRTDARRPTTSTARTGAATTGAAGVEKASGSSALPGGPAGGAGGDEGYTPGAATTTSTSAAPATPQLTPTPPAP